MPAPDDPSSRRLIVPGAEPEPRSTPRIVLPGSNDDPPPASAPDADASTGRSASRIILPPGVTTVPDDVPDYPKLRPLILMPFADGQRELLLVQDPLGVIDGQPVLGMESVALLQLFDGNTSLHDITAALMRESKDLRVANMVKDFVAKLDQLLMLDSPRFQAAYQALRDAYHPLEIRPSVFDGRSYPADRAELVKFLDDHFATAEQWRAEDAAAADAMPSAGGTPSAGATPNAGAGPNAPSAGVPRAFLVPHLDPRRAGATMARAFLELDRAGAEREPLRIVVFGTGHSLMGDMFALTRKHFDTPLGRAECDTAFVDMVARQLGDAAYRSELVHRDEHSIEFQALYLKHRLGERRFTIVPILCGGFHALLDEGRTPREHPEFETLIQSLRDAVSARGGRTVYVASVDFSHVGPRFGDPVLDERTLGEIEAIDRDAIEAARLGDADGWFRAIASHDDSTRICGFAPIYAMLRCAEPGAGRLLRYEKSTEKDGSLVSVASMVW